MVPPTNRTRGRRPASGAGAGGAGLKGKREQARKREQAQSIKRPIHVGRIASNTIASRPTKITSAKSRLATSRNTFPTRSMCVLHLQRCHVEQPTSTNVRSLRAQFA